MVNAPNIAMGLSSHLAFALETRKGAVSDFSHCQTIDGLEPGSPLDPLPKKKAPQPENRL
jgi:hypothetical protein